MIRRRPCASRAALLGALALMLGAAPSALADSTQSANWAGYAAHSSSVRFRRVFGAWRQPTTSCTAGSPTFSSVWVGLGGYNINSSALEQIGSEADCTATGQIQSSVWYELVPAPSRTIRMRVDPGDYLSASTYVSGHQVTLTLYDLTRHTSFTRTVRIGTPDISSAEWIVEAPSECTGSNSCSELPLANFGSAQFTRASVTTTRGQHAAISNRRWTTTKIILATGGKTFISSPAPVTTASPSPLVAGGSAFTVTYASSAGSPPSPTANTRRAALRAGGFLRRPGRMG